MEGDPLDVEASEQLRREVEARGRRGGRAGLARVDGLVALGVVERLVDVRRQRRLAVRLAGRGADATGPRRAARAARPGRGAGRRAAAARAGRAPPRGRRRCARRAAPPPLPPPAVEAHAGRDDAGVVDHHQLVESSSGSSLNRRCRTVAGRPLVHEQPGLVAPLGRVLGDQLRRQLVLQLRRSSSDGQVVPPMDHDADRAWPSKASRGSAEAHGRLRRRGGAGARATGSSSSPRPPRSSRRRCRPKVGEAVRKASRGGAAGRPSARRGARADEPGAPPARAPRGRASRPSGTRASTTSRCSSTRSSGWRGRRRVSGSHGSSACSTTVERPRRRGAASRCA